MRANPNIKQRWVGDHTFEIYLAEEDRVLFRLEVLSEEMRNKLDGEHKGIMRHLYGDIVSGALKESARDAGFIAEHVETEEVEGGLRLKVYGAPDA